MSGVYVITDGELFKIGIAEDPMKRRQELQCGNGRRLRLTFFHETDSLASAKWLEAKAHMRLKELRLSGEWFRCMNSCAVWAIMDTLYKADPDVNPEPEDEEGLL